MDIDTRFVMRRLAGHAAVALVAIAGFAAAWTTDGLSRAFQGAISFASAVLFVIAFHEVVSCRDLLREMRSRSGDHA